MTIEIYQTFHRSFPQNKNCTWLTPVAVGNHQDASMLRDNTGDNIAHLNPYFGEFTTMYWAWKNRNLPDIVGFYHYRRFLHLRGDDFGFEWEGKIDKGTHYQVNLDYAPEVLDFVTSDEYGDRIEVMMESTEAIMGFPMRFDITVPQQWAQCHPTPAFMAFIEALENQYPNQRYQIRNFFASYGQINWPIMIMRRATFIRFCEQLFPLLFSVFKKIGTPYDAYQNRYVCFIVERFIPMWLLLENINPRYVPTMSFFTNQIPLVPGTVPIRTRGMLRDINSSKGF
jgi:Domain of unknown function (DUF4422)